MGMDCKYCGAYISSDVEKCPACGKRVSKSDGFGFGSGAAQAYAEEKSSNAYTYKEEYTRRYGNEEYEGYTGERTTTSQNFKNKSEEYKEKAREYTEKAEAYVRNTVSNEAEQNKLLAYLSYFGILFVVPLIFRGDDKFCRFHANQGLVLFIANIILNVIGGFTLIGWIVRAFSWIFSLVCFVCGLRNVYRGEMRPLPIIGAFQIL